MPLGRIPSARLTAWPAGSFVSPEFPTSYCLLDNHQESNLTPVAPTLDQRGGIEPPISI